MHPPAAARKQVKKTQDGKQFKQPLPTLPRQSKQPVQNRLIRAEILAKHFWHSPIVIS